MGNGVSSAPCCGTRKRRPNVPISRIPKVPSAGRHQFVVVTSTSGILPAARIRTQDGVDWMYAEASRVKRTDGTSIGEDSGPEEEYILDYFLYNYDHRCLARASRRLGTDGADVSFFPCDGSEEGSMDNWIDGEAGRSVPGKRKALLHISTRTCGTRGSAVGMNDGTDDVTFSSKAPWRVDYDGSGIFLGNDGPTWELYRDHAATGMEQLHCSIKQRGATNGGGGRRTRHVRGKADASTFHAKDLTVETTKFCDDAALCCFVAWVMSIVQPMSSNSTSISLDSRRSHVAVLADTIPKGRVVSYRDIAGTPLPASP